MSLCFVWLLNQIPYENCISHKRNIKSEHFHILSLFQRTSDILYVFFLPVRLLLSLKGMMLFGQDCGSVVGVSVKNTLHIH